MFSLFLSGALLAPLATACGLTKFENLVTFGDSLTDDGRAAFLMEAGGADIPPGTEIPVVNITASGGKTWGRFVAESAGANYNNYAVQGGTCSQKTVEITQELIGAPFPTMLEYGVAAYEADIDFENLYPNRRPDNTVYALWVGTNDLGYAGFLTDKQTPNSTLPVLTECMWDIFDHIYETGGRYFVLLTVPPLNQAPLYMPAEDGGVESSMSWPEKSSVNATAYQEKMRQYSTSVAYMIHLGTPFHAKLKERWPGATFVVFDTNKLMREMMAAPERYFEEPASVTDVFNCNAVDVSHCTEPSGELSGYMWFDDLHPSERTSELQSATHVVLILCY